MNRLIRDSLIWEEREQEGEKGKSDCTRYLTIRNFFYSSLLSLRDSETVGKKEKKLTGLPINYEEESTTVNIVDWD
jgi:hypothetical protein